MRLYFVEEGFLEENEHYSKLIRLRVLYLNLPNFQRIPGFKIVNSFGYLHVVKKNLFEQYFFFNLLF